MKELEMWWAGTCVAGCVIRHSNLCPQQITHLSLRAATAAVVGFDVLCCCLMSWCVCCSYCPCSKRWRRWFVSHGSSPPHVRQQSHEKQQQQRRRRPTATPTATSAAQAAQQQQLRQQRQQQQRQRREVGMGSCRLHLRLCSWVLQQQQQQQQVAALGLERQALQCSARGAHLLLAVLLLRED